MVIFYYLKPNLSKVNSTQRLVYMPLRFIKNKLSKVIKLFKKDKTSNNTETSNGIYTLLAVVNDPKRSFEPNTYTFSVKIEDIKNGVIKPKSASCFRDKNDPPYMLSGDKSIQIKTDELYFFRFNEGGSSTGLSVTPENIFKLLSLIYQRGWTLEKLSQFS